MNNNVTPTLSIIVPVFNEESTVNKALHRVISQPLSHWSKEIIVVDDGSTDTTPQKLAQFIPHIKLLHHPANYGRGQALRTGLAAASGQAILFQDADLEYDPADWPKLLKQFAKANTKVVYGTRTINPKHKGYRHYVIGARLLTELINFLYKSNLTDLYTGYKLFNTEVLKSLNLTSNGFELEVEITSKLLKKGVKIREVPINYYPRTFKEGKKVTIFDGIKGFLQILFFKLQ